MNAFLMSVLVEIYYPNIFFIYFNVSKSQLGIFQACGIVVELIKAKKMAGRAILLAGPPGT